MNSDQSFKDDWRVKVPRHEVKIAVMTLNQWIEREFAGHGVAVRAKSEQAIPGEPFMSMAVAKDLTRRAVAEFGLINATERQDAPVVGVIELPPFPFHREA